MPSEDQAAAGDRWFYPFALGFGLGIIVPLITALLLLLPFSKAGLAVGFALPGLLVIFGIVSFIAFIAIGAFDARSGVGFALGLAALLFVPPVIVKSMARQDQAAAEKAFSDFVSPSVGVFSKRHNVIELVGLPGDNHEVQSYVPRITLGSEYMVQLAQNGEQRVRAYRSGSGAECWTARNVELNIKFLLDGWNVSHSRCVVEVAPNTTANAVVILTHQATDQLLKEHKLPRPSNRADFHFAFIAERIDGAIKVVTRIASVYVGASPLHGPDSPICRSERYISSVAICQVTGVSIRAAHGGEPAQPEALLNVALPLIGSADRTVQRSGLQLIKTATSRQIAAKQVPSAEMVETVEAQLFPEAMRLIAREDRESRWMAAEIVSGHLGPIADQPFSEARRRQFLGVVLSRLCDLKTVKVSHWANLFTDNYVLARRLIQITPVAVDRPTFVCIKDWHEDGRTREFTAVRSFLELALKNVEVR